MPSTASTTYQDFIEGKLISSMTTTTTTGVTFKIKQINGATPTAPTAAYRLKIVQRTATNNKVEIVGVAAGSTQSGQTVTLGTLTRALPLDDGTDFTGSGTAQSFAAGADVFLAWDSHDAALTVKKDLTNEFTALSTFSTVDFTTDGDEYFELPSLTTTERDALTAAEGMMVYNETTSQLNSYEGGNWVASTSGSVANASTTVAGKVEEATVAEQGTSTGTGDTGARLFPSTANLIKAHAIYTPAYLTGGGSATAHGALWTGVTDGSFTISIDGTEYDITGLDFSSTTDEDDIAAAIQVAIRAATSSTETCVWSTDHFIISSVLTTSSSAITVTSAVGSGTDISGAGATEYMDAETGQGTATAKVINPSADENKLTILNSSGVVGDGLLGTGTASASNYLLGDRSWGIVPSIFGDGSDGAKVIAASENLNPANQYNYTTLTLNVGQTLGLSSVNTPLIVNCAGDVTINGTIDLDADGGAGGASPGTGTNTAGNVGVDGHSLLTTVLVCGGGGAPAGAAAGGGGGGGGGASMLGDGTIGSGSGEEGAAGVKSEGFELVSSLLRGVCCGGGGSSGGLGANSGTAGAGGAGGGAMVLSISGNLTFGAASTITADGVVGANGSGSDEGGGGGGGGGTVLIMVTGSITDGGVTLTATAGAGGTANDNGGGGKAGKIIIYSLLDGTIITS